MTESPPGLERPALLEHLQQRLNPPSVVRHQEPLAKRTTLRVGGPAEWYVEPATEEDLGATLRFATEQHLPLFILGRGSNLLIRDAGVPGVVVCLNQPSFSRIEVDGELLRCGAGARLKAVAVEAKRHELAGFEFLEGIPGSLGGGLRMNAGAMGGAMFDLVESLRLMDFQGRVETRTSREVTVEYRCCESLKSRVALGAVLRGRPGSRDEIQRRMMQMSQKRWDSQPAAPSAGCIFKNPPSIAAGRLVDELGLKGTRVGGAFVSSEHGNFIVNDGTAKAADVLELIGIIRQRAREQRGIELETEVEIIGV